MKDQQTYYEEKLAFEMDAWDLFESIERGEKITIVDARSKEAYENEHIPNSVNIPHREMTKESTARLDKSQLYITYCDGIGCNASTKGALNMTKLGFNVKELIGGLDWWKRDNYETHGNNASNGHPIKCGC